MIQSVSDIQEDKSYCLELCQTDTAKRIFKLVESDAEEKSSEAYYRTGIVDNDLLVKRSLIAISKATKLDNGDKFYVDPHGMWITQKESDQLESGVGFFEVEWETKELPLVARREVVPNQLRDTLLIDAALAGLRARNPNCPAIIVPGTKNVLSGDPLSSRVFLTDGSLIPLGFKSVDEFSGFTHHLNQGLRWGLVLMMLFQYFKVALLPGLSGFIQ